MKKIICIVALLMPLWVVAADRSANEAAQVAAEFMNSNQVKSPKRQAGVNATSFNLSHTRMKVDSESPAFYVFNRADAGGFVVVSGDDRTEDILMYSDEGELNVNTANPNLLFWLNHLQEEISMVSDENAVDKSAARKMVQVEKIEPLLRNKNDQLIKWDQEDPYWNECPMDLWKTSERCLTGCVATATAQVMCKWSYPVKGTGLHSYTWECCTNSSCTKTKAQKLSMDFDTVSFDWDNMLGTYNSKATDKQEAAVARLMYACGVACSMGYGGETIGGSGAWTDDMAYALKTYFGYRLNKYISMYERSDYSQAKGAKLADVPSEWNVTKDSIAAYFNADLEAGRPIVMGGEGSEGAHAFVCDGRDANGKFHINWGWSGTSNCYCTLQKLAPSKSSYNFSSNIDAIIGLEPDVAQGVEELQSRKEDTGWKKVMMNGQLYLIKGEKVYTVFGQEK